MSIKVYTGIKIVDFNKFMEELNHLKTRILSGEFINNEKGKTVFELLTDLEVKEEVGEDNLKLYRDKLLEMYDKGGNKYTDELVELYVGVYPNGLGVVYDKISNSKDSYYNKILDFESVEEYGYWDNVDMPEDLKEWEWNMRKIAWENAIGGYEDIHKEFDNRLLIEVIKEEFNYKKVMKMVGDYRDSLRSQDNK